MIYELIGRIWVGFIRRRYGREIRIAGAAGVTLAALAFGAYLATRDADES